jgi:hypothetical protein
MAWNWSGAGQGAMSGASTGSAFGPWGAVIGGVGGGIIGGLSSKDKGGSGGGGGNPADAGMPYLDKISGTVSPYYQPYIQGGQTGLDALINKLMPQYQNMINNPTQMMGQIGNNYWGGQQVNPYQMMGKMGDQYFGGKHVDPNQLMEQFDTQYFGKDVRPEDVSKELGSRFQASPGYQYNVDQQTKAANQAAAAGGYVGSPAEQAALAKNVHGLADQDYNDYLNREMAQYNAYTGANLGQYNTNMTQGLGQYNNYMNQGIGQYNTGLSGMGNTGQFLSQLGYTASNDLANTLATTLMNQAILAYAGQANQNQQGNQGGGMMGGMGSMFGGQGGQGGGMGGMMSMFGGQGGQGGGG